jgi:SAM-dependent methyltransferase
VTGADAGGLGRVFNEVPELYDRTRPTYPDALFADLTEITGLGQRSRVLEVGCGTGQATRSLAPLGCRVTAVEPGDALAALARQRLAPFGNVNVESSTFEDWDDRGRRFDVLVAAASWHWVDPAVGWPKARDVLSPGGWVALLGSVTVRRPGEPGASCWPGSARSCAGARVASSPARPPRRPCRSGTGQLPTAGYRARRGHQPSDGLCVGRPKRCSGRPL